MVAVDRVKERADALEFLKEAAMALDQAEACLRVLDEQNSRPRVGRTIDRTVVFPNCHNDAFRVSQNLFLTCSQMVDAVLAMHAEVAEGDFIR